MAPRAFRIFRATNADGSLDPQAKFVFDPSIDSDELFDALRVEYPGIKTHAERKRQAVMDFLVREREDDLRALDMLVGDQVASPAVITSAASNFTPAPSSAEPTPESNASPGQPSPIELPPSAMFKSSKSSSAFQVWDPSSNKPVKLHSRRRMTEQEKEEYRMRRLLGSCDSCKQKRRKCRHFLEASPPSKSRSRKAKASRAASSSNASPLINMHSASESGSDSSPTESLTQTFSHDMSAPPSAVFNNEDLFPISEIPFDQSFGSDFTLFSEGAADLDLLPMTDQPLFNTPPPLVNSPVAQYHLNNADWSFMNNNAGLFDANADWLNAPIDATFEDFSHAVSSDLHRIDSGGTQRHVLNQQFQAASTDWNSLLQEQMSPAQSGLLARPQLESAEAVQASSAALGGLISTDRALQAQQRQQRESRSVVISGRLRSNQPGIQTDLHGSPVIGGYTDNDRGMMLDRASPGTFLSSASASPSTSQYSDVMDQGMLIDSQFYGKNLEASEPVPHVPRKRKQDQRQSLEGSLQSSQSGGLQSIGGSSRFYSQEAPQLVRYGHASCTSTPDGEQRISVGIESYGPASDSVIRQGLFPSRPGEQGSFSSSSSQTPSSSTPASQASSPVLERAGVVLASSSLRQASSSPRAGDHASSSSDSSSNASTAVRYSPAPDNQVRWAATLQPGAASGGAIHSLPPASNDAAVMLSSQTPLQSSPASAAPSRSNASSAAATAAILSPTELASGRQPAAASLQQMTSSPTNASQTLLSLSTSRDGNSQLSFSGPSWLAFAIFSLLLVSYVVVKLGFPVATASAVGIMMKQTVSQKVSSVVSHGLLLGLVAVGGDVFVGRTGCSRYT